MLQASCSQCIKTLLYVMLHAMKVGMPPRLQYSANWAMFWIAAFKTDGITAVHKRQKKKNQPSTILPSISPHARKMHLYPLISACNTSTKAGAAPKDAGNCSHVVFTLLPFPRCALSRGVGWGVQPDRLPDARLNLLPLHLNKHEILTGLISCCVVLNFQGNENSRTSIFWQSMWGA